MKEASVTGAPVPVPDASPCFGMVAGEASGDLLAGLLLDGLREGWPGMRAVGIGGPQMRQRGFEAWWPHDKLSVHGFGWEVLRRFREILGIRNQLKARLLQQRPAVFIGVDAPDFNLDLEAALRQQGIKTVHFVCPSFWAWRAKRVQKIRASVDHVLCIFPFEPALLAEHGIAATYVGHPLANVIPMVPDRATARLRLGLAPDDLVIALLPGSRGSEVRNLALRFFRAAVLLQQQRPAVKFIVPAIPSLKAEIERAAAACGALQHLQIVTGESHAVLAACDVSLVASGTATLEAALFKRPMVIAYHMSWLSWQLVRRRMLQPWVGLPNILCREFVVPELLQDGATPQALSRALLDWLDAAQQTPEKITALQEKFSALHLQLQRDTPRLAAHAIQQVLQT
jgi:lipid-A-disaccharide synthase